MKDKRPPVKIKFRFNLETGAVEEFIIDDNAAGASEGYHDQVALAVADRLARKPQINDAGPRCKTFGSSTRKISAKKVQEQAASELDDKF